MTTRKQLYAMGEPLGDSATERKPGGGIRYGGGGGGGSSSSSTTTTNIDKRLAVGDGGIGNTGDNVSVNVTDGGIVSRALDTIDLSNATNADGFGKLLEASTRLFDRGENLIGQTQKGVADAYASAQAQKTGSIDNKTIIILAVAGAAAVVMIQRGK